MANGAHSLLKIQNLASVFLRPIPNINFTAKGILLRLAFDTIALGAEVVFCLQGTLLAGIIGTEVAGTSLSGASHDP